ncbi:MAG: BrnT family toxin [Cyanobacteria bacterium J06649_4]
MGDLVFEWDERKAQKNERKHGISFEEAQTAFEDENARLLYDPEHSQDEDRYILLGMSSILRVLVVCHVYRQNDELIRLISARRATKKEQKQYQRFSS